jgi:alcohol dehydrogenase class IV
MSIASLLGGLCLANAKLGAVHGYASVLGGMYETAPHGAICAALLAPVYRKNAEKLAEAARGGDRVAAMRLARFVEVARRVTGNPEATVWQGAAWLEALVLDLGVPPLSKICDIQASQVQEVAEATAIASSTKGNPVTLSVQELKDILLSAF